jgi:hypothetical protein
VRGPLFALLALLCASCGSGEGRVDPADYGSFFLWGGISAGAYLERGQEFYILAGEVRGREGARLEPRRPQVPKMGERRVWLVVRSEVPRWSPAVRDAVLRDVARWAAANPRFEGLQVDFDSATRDLSSYAAFLRSLREVLPPGYKLSVTGLLDWSANADPADLAALSGTVDEIVVQTYQGRSTVPGYQAYLGSLKRLPLPYKVGLVDGGEWRPPYWLEHSQANFRGYVVFLIPPAKRP